MEKYKVEIQSWGHKRVRKDKIFTDSLFRIDEKRRDFFVTVPKKYHKEQELHASMKAYLQQQQITYTNHTFANITWLLIECLKDDRYRDTFWAAARALVKFDIYNTKTWVVIAESMYVPDHSEN